jgi:hypothetical protein
MFLATCQQINIAQPNKKNISAKESQAWKELEKSKDTTRMLITAIKELSDQKIIYRTKLVIRIDTVWRIDTCVTVFTPIDSATIAVMFKNRDVKKKTTFGKIIKFIFTKKNK